MSKLIPLAILIANALCAAERPNILFLMTDQQRWDSLGANGNPLVRTPNRPILLKGDARLTAGDVRRVMKRARAAGAKGIALGVEHEEAK